MFNNPPNDDKTDLQRDILRVHDQNPDAGPKEIASICDCSESYARETINEYRGGNNDPFGLGGSGGGLL